MLDAEGFGTGIVELASREKHIVEQGGSCLATLPSFMTMYREVDLIINPSESKLSEPPVKSIHFGGLELLHPFAGNHSFADHLLCSLGRGVTRLKVPVYSKAILNEKVYTLM